MSAQNGGFMDVFEYKIMPKVYGIGAAIVIVGALFKLMHWPFASIMLIAGLGTEALIFIASAFMPVHKDPAWERVYPQLADEYYDGYGDEEAATPENVTGSLNEMMAGANITQDTISKLGVGLNSLSENVSKMSDMSDAAAATSEYAANVKSASKSLTEMGKSYATTAEAMAGMASAASDAKEYHAQVQAITKNLGSLNAVYEMELQDANNHLKAMNKFYSNLSSAMENMADASKDTDAFKKELNKLSTNLTALNNVYGSMLTAMKGS